MLQIQDPLCFIRADELRIRSSEVWEGKGALT